MPKYEGYGFTPRALELNKASVLAPLNIPHPDSTRQTTLQGLSDLGLPTSLATAARIHQSTETPRTEGARRTMAWRQLNGELLNNPKWETTYTNNHTTEIIKTLATLSNRRTARRMRNTNGLVQEVATKMGYMRVRDDSDQLTRTLLLMRACGAVYADQNREAMELFRTNLQEYYVDYNNQPPSTKKTAEERGKITTANFNSAKGFYSGLYEKNKAGVVIRGRTIGAILPYESQYWQELVDRKIWGKSTEGDNTYSYLPIVRPLLISQFRNGVTTQETVDQLTGETGVLVSLQAARAMMELLVRDINLDKLGQPTTDQLVGQSAN